MNREPTKNLRLVNCNERCLKGRNPVRGSRRQTRLGSHSVVATTLLSELSGLSEKMKMKRKSENRYDEN